MKSENRSIKIRESENFVGKQRERKKENWRTSKDQRVGIGSSSAAIVERERERVSLSRIYDMKQLASKQAALLRGC